MLVCFDIRLGFIEFQRLQEDLSVSQFVFIGLIFFTGVEQLGADLKRSLSPLRRNFMHRFVVARLSAPERLCRSLVILPFPFHTFISF